MSARVNGLALLAFLALSGVVGVVSWAIDKVTVEQEQARLTFLAEQARLRVEDFIRPRAAGAKILALDWEYRDGDLIWFHDRAQAFMDGLAGFQGFSWIDKDHVIRRSHPIEANRAAIGKDLSNHPIVRPLMDQVAADLTPRLSGPVELFQGGIGQIIYAPVTDGNSRSGFVSAIISFEKARDILFPPSMGAGAHYAVTMSDSGTPLLTVPLGESQGSSVSAAASAQALNRTWTITLQSAGYFGAAGSVVLWGGLALSALLAVALRTLFLRQAALSDSRARYASLLSATPLGVAVIDLKGRFTYSNAAHDALLGYEEGELEGVALTDLLVAEDEREGFQHYLNDLLTDKADLRPWTGFVRAKSGAVKPLRADWGYERGSDDAVTGFIAVVTDSSEQLATEKAQRMQREALQEAVQRRTSELSKEINERTQAQSDLEEQTTLLELLLNTIPDVVCLRDGEGHWLVANHAARKALSLGSGNISGLTSLHLEERFEGFKADMLMGGSSDDVVWKRRKPLRSEMLLTDPDTGQDKIYDVIKAPAFSRGGDRRCLVIVARDETARRRNQEAVLRLSRQNQMILDAAGEGIFGVDLDDRLTFVNPACASILGWEADDLLGRSSVQDIYRLDPETNEPFLAEDCALSVQFAGDDSTMATQDVFRDSGGEPVPVEFISAPMEENGLLTGAVVIFRDVTHLRAAERDLAAKATELQRSNAELEQFAYVASHDLREPLRMVNSYLGLLERRLGDDLSAENKEFIHYATDGAQRMDGLIQDLLNYSRVGRMSRPWQEVSVDKVLTRVRSDLSVALEESNGLLSIGPGMPVVMADDQELARLFMNLIGNGLKYHDETRPPVVTVSCELKETFWQFSIADNGIGIAENQYDRVFMIFQRLHGAGKYKGSGVGLAICKKIVERHGGEIWVTSTPGEGSIFQFTLPTKETSPATSGSEA